MDSHSQGSKPSGITGKIIGRLMNLFHLKIYKRYFKTHLPAENSKILDLGCGGGKFIYFLAQQKRSYKLTGLDHSAEMINLSQRINHKNEEENKIQFHLNTVAALPFKDNEFDYITVLETIQFWPELRIALKDIFRVLKKKGSLIIINRYPEQGSKWWKRAQIKSDEEYYRILKESGFTQIKTDLNQLKRWIIVEAVK